MSEEPKWYQGMTCPRCGEPFTRWPARSRVDNNTYVCDPCGTREALFDQEHQGQTPLPPVTEPVVLGVEGERVMDDVTRLSKEHDGRTT